MHRSYDDNLKTPSARQGLSNQVIWISSHICKAFSMSNKYFFFSLEYISKRGNRFSNITWARSNILEGSSELQGIIVKEGILLLKTEDMKNRYNFGFCMCINQWKIKIFDINSSSNKIFSAFFIYLPTVLLLLWNHFLKWDK